LAELKPGHIFDSTRISSRFSRKMLGTRMHR